MAKPPRSFSLIQHSRALASNNCLWMVWDEAVVLHNMWVGLNAILPQETVAHCHRSAQALRPQPLWLAPQLELLAVPHSLGPEKRTQSKHQATAQSSGGGALVVLRLQDFLTTFGSTKSKDPGALGVFGVPRSVRKCFSAWKKNMFSTRMSSSPW